VEGGKDGKSREKLLMGENTPAKTLPGLKRQSYLKRREEIKAVLGGEGSTIQH